MATLIYHITKRNCETQHKYWEWGLEAKLMLMQSPKTNTKKNIIIITKINN